MVWIILLTGLEVTLLAFIRVLTLVIWVSRHHWVFVCHWIIHLGINSLAWWGWRWEFVHAHRVVQSHWIVILTIIIILWVLILGMLMPPIALYRIYLTLMGHLMLNWRILLVIPILLKLFLLVHSRLFKRFILKGREIWLFEVNICQ